MRGEYVPAQGSSKPTAPAAPRGSHRAGDSPVAPEPRVIRLDVPRPLLLAVGGAAWWGENAGRGPLAPRRGLMGRLSYADAAPPR